MASSILLALRIMISGVLYLFVVWALWVLWQDIRKRSQEKSSLKVPTIQLSTVEEPGKQWKYNQAQLIIGRDSMCDCQLDDPTISARHARLIFHHGHWWVEDLKSRNGTKLNLLPVTEQVVLTSEDVLQCGMVGLQIVIEEILPVSDLQK